MIPADKEMLKTLGGCIRYVFLLIIFGCNNSSDNGSQDVVDLGETKIIPFENVLIPVAGAQTLEEQYPGVDLSLIDTETKIPASNVKLKSKELSLQGIGRLKSENLKDALENELAVDLKTLLPGSKWKVTSKFYLKKLSDKGQQDGIGISLDNFTNSVILFHDTNKVTIESGCIPLFSQFACRNVGSSEGEFSVKEGSYHLVGNNMIGIYFDVDHPSRENPRVEALVTFPEVKKELMLGVNYNSDSIGTEAAEFVRILE